MTGGCMRLWALLVIAIPIMGCSSQTHQNVKYPDRSHMLRQNGVVVVNYDVNERGVAENIKIVSAEPHGVFEKSVKSHVRNWRFEKGKPQQDITTTITFDSK